METAPSRRLDAVRRHLLVAPDDPSHLERSLTASPFVDERGQSVVLPEKLHTGKWQVYRSSYSPFKLLSRFIEHPDISTLHDNFVRSAETFRDSRYLGTRVRDNGTVGEYNWMTYGDVSIARSAIGSALVNLGLPKGSCVGLYFINRPEWVIADHACSAYSYISVPLYDTLGPDAAKYIINHASVQAIFCLSRTLNTLLSILQEMPSVRVIVVVGGLTDEKPSLSVHHSPAGVEVITYAQFIDQGLKFIQPFCPSNPDDIATICYTSGTTGTPKGVVLTHGNMIANTAGVSLNVKFNPSDVMLSYLPLAHIYERGNVNLSTYYGASVGFYQGDNLKLMDDLAVLRPTVFCSVPRLYNRIYAGIVNAVRSSGPLKERLFHTAFHSKKRAMQAGKRASPVWDKLVFNKIKEKLGGRVRLMASGASPLSPDVLVFLSICFGCPLLEGYGLTETCSVACCTRVGDTLAGHVGSPNPACEIKLADVPEMKYGSEDRPHPRGEVCVRGPGVFRGYYRDAEMTREAVDDDGWLHTGDIGSWLPGGRLKIIDRKKNIFKLAQGEYVAPEKIENVYTHCAFVSQCFVYGDSFNSSLVAVVSVDVDVLRAWASSQGIKYGSLHEACDDERARSAVLEAMDAVAREQQLRGFECVKSVRLILEPFTLENGLLTPTFKIKRPQAKAYFAKAITDMYAELSEENPSLQNSL